MRLEALLALAQEAGYQKRCWEEYDERSQRVQRHPVYERDAAVEKGLYEEAMDKLNEGEAAFKAETDAWMPEPRESDVAHERALLDPDSLDRWIASLGLVVSVAGSRTWDDLRELSEFLVRLRETR